MVKLPFNQISSDELPIIDGPVTGDRSNAAGKDNI